MQKITPSPLQLERYYLKEIFFKINKDPNISEEEFYKLRPPQLEISGVPSQVGRDKHRWACELSVSGDGSSENTPYNFRIVLVGEFKIAKDYPDDRIELLAKVNGPSILYSTARELLVTTLRRGPFPPILLPVVTFREVDDEGGEELERKTQVLKAKRKKPIKKT